MPAVREERRKMPLGVESEHEGLMQRDGMAPQVEPETKKPRKKSLRLREPCYLSLIVYLSSS